MLGRVAQFLPQRKEPEESAELEGVTLGHSLAVTSRCRRLGERLKATTGRFREAFLQRSEERSRL